MTSDGRHAIFSSLRSGIHSAWMVSLDGVSEPTPIVNEFVSGNSLDLDREDERLLFTSSNDRNEPMLVVCDFPACSNRRELDVPPNAFGPSGIRRWTPDGEGIAYVGPGGTNIWSMPLDGGPPRQLTNFTDRERTVVSFAWSHDGSRLAVLRAATTTDVVLVRGLQGAVVRGASRAPCRDEGRGRGDLGRWPRRTAQMAGESPAARRMSEPAHPGVCRAFRTRSMRHAGGA